MNKYALAVIAFGVGAIVTVPVFSHAAREKYEYKYDSHSSLSAPILSKACIEAMAVVDDASVTHVETDAQTRKDALIARSAALKAAALIKNDEERSAAVKKAKDDYTKASHIVQGDDVKAAMEAQMLVCSGQKPKKPSTSRGSTSSRASVSSKRGR